MDIAIKTRYFTHLLGGGDPEAEAVYRWHIEARSGLRMRAGYATDGWKESLDDYVTAAKALASSMPRGFIRAHPIPIDRSAELLGGAHRLACALVLDCDVYVEHIPTQAWAPDWGRRWFIDNACPSEYLDRATADWEELCRRQRTQSE